jgi:hypothetical protein
LNLLQSLTEREKDLFTAAFYSGYWAGSYFILENMGLSSDGIDSLVDNKELLFKEFKFL